MNDLIGFFIGSFEVDLCWMSIILKTLAIKSILKLQMTAELNLWCLHKLGFEVLGQKHRECDSPSYHHNLSLSSLFYSLFSLAKKVNSYNFLFLRNFLFFPLKKPNKFILFIPFKTFKLLKIFLNISKRIDNHKLLSSICIYY